MPNDEQAGGLYELRDGKRVRIPAPVEIRIDVVPEPVIEPVPESPDVDTGLPRLPRRKKLEGSEL